MVPEKNQKAVAHYSLLSNTTSLPKSKTLVPASLLFENSSCYPGNQTVMLSSKGGCFLSNTYSLDWLRVSECSPGKKCGGRAGLQVYKMPRLTESHHNGKNGTGMPKAKKKPDPKGHINFFFLEKLTEMIMSSLPHPTSHIGPAGSEELMENQPDWKICSVLWGFCPGRALGKLELYSDNKNDSLKAV